jgi:hypothetical protein
MNWNITFELESHDFAWLFAGSFTSCGFGLDLEIGSRNNDTPIKTAIFCVRSGGAARKVLFFAGRVVDG